MSLADIVNSCRDELGEVNVRAIKLEPDLARVSVPQEDYQTGRQELDCRGQNNEETRSSNGRSIGESSTNGLHEHPWSINDTNLSSESPISAGPICRQFWKAGSYEGLASKSSSQKSGSYLRIHPKFLHSNATSHKWAFGAIAELLDNAVDEIQNGATIVILDKILNPRDGRPALLIQDDGGGMDPEGMRRCLSFGFSDKKSKSAIGRYGNGFKTSSMRLGADVIVFTRHLKESKLTQSCGLLSYTFLMQAGYDRIVVPMVDYEFNIVSNKFEMLNGFEKELFMSNLSMLVQWSPYSTEDELLKQFDDIGCHGAKVIIYNLWHDDEGAMELDFDSDPKDIRLSGSAKVSEKGINRFANEQHMANQLRYSLRVYLSILYLHLPENFGIMLRGKFVQYHNIGSDLKYPEVILYKPQCGGSVESVIGFLKEAPHVNIHGFNIYHKNRLILPFWHVVSYSDSRGRGVVGVLEANFIEPTHNKQDFEKTPVFQKLEARLKDMTWEYWDHHCRLIGYRPNPKKPNASVASAQGTSLDNRIPAMLNKDSFMPASATAVPQGPQSKRKEGCHSEEPKLMKRRHGDIPNGIDMPINQPVWSSVDLLEDNEAANLMQENKKLRAQCMEYEKNEEELNLKITHLWSELEDAEHEYARLLSVLRLLEEMKDENHVR